MGTRNKQVDVKQLIKDTINELFAEEQFIEMITQKISDKVNQKLEKFESKIKTFEEKITTLEKTIENMQQAEKINNICIYGINENNNMDLKELIPEILNEKTQLEITSEDIDMCFRIGKKSENVQKPRPIIIKFKNYTTKHRVLRNCSKLKGTRIFVTEDLIKPKRELLREAQERFGVKLAWPYNGSVYIKLEGKNVKLNCREDIIKYPTQN